jgi:hypothetical protein
MSLSLLQLWTTLYSNTSSNFTTKHWTKAHIQTFRCLQIFYYPLDYTYHMLSKILLKHSDSNYLFIFPPNYKFWNLNIKSHQFFFITWFFSLILSFLHFCIPLLLSHFIISSFLYFSYFISYLIIIDNNSNKLFFFSFGFYVCISNNICLCACRFQTLLHDHWRKYVRLDVSKKIHFLCSYITYNK